MSRQEQRVKGVNAEARAELGQVNLRAHRVEAGEGGREDSDDELHRKVGGDDDEAQEVDDGHRRAVGVHERVHHVARPRVQRQRLSWVRGDGIASGVRGGGVGVEWGVGGSFRGCVGC